MLETLAIGNKIVFSDIKQQVIKNFEKLSKGTLFYVEVDRDEISKASRKKIGRSITAHVAAPS